jgi:hypothetical protein
MLGNEFGIKTCECSGVCCEGVMVAFLFISAKSFLAQTTSGLLVLSATLLDIPGTGEALRVFFCDREATAGISNNVTMLET